MSHFSDEEEQSLFKELASKPYGDQAKLFLNTFWSHKLLSLGEDANNREKIWELAGHFCKCDKKLGEKGSSLDEFEAHQFLEKAVGAMTVADMRVELAKIDLDSDRRMSLLEFLMFHYEIPDAAQLVRWVASGSESQREVLKAVQAQTTKAYGALKSCLDFATASKEEAKKATDAAKTSAEAAELSEKAAIDLGLATAEMERQEKAKRDALAIEELKANDATLSTVKRNKAIAQVAILKAEDSQPLRTARITSGAAERKAKKAAKIARTAEAAAKEAAKAAEKAAHLAEMSAEEADNEVAMLTDKLEEAKALTLGKTDGAPSGTLWWLEREFEDSLQYMGPKQKQKALAAKDKSKRKSGSFNTNVTTTKGQSFNATSEDKNKTYAS